MGIPLLQHAFLPRILTDELRKRYELVDAQSLGPEEFGRRRSDFTVLLTNGEDVVDRELIESLPNLQLIADFGVGYDGIDVAAASARGIAVSNTPGVLTDDVSDLAIGLLLSVARQIPAAGRFIEDGRWRTDAYPWTTKVSGASLGIVGLGRIGRAVAHKAQAFDLRVSYTDRAPLDGVAYPFLPDAESLAGHTDFLVVCAPGGDATRKLIDERVIAAVGPQGILVNVARGSIVDEKALVRAVVEGRIGGVGMDVFADEPNVPPQLLHRANVVVTPHMASATWATRREMARLVARNVDAWVGSHRLVTPVTASA